MKTLKNFAVQRSPVRQWGLSVMVLALFLACGCKPSVEGETRAWDQNKLTLQEWSGRFANFRPAIDSRVAEAQTDFDVAKSMGDPDARAAKMREANDKLYALTTAFQEIDRKLKEYDRLKADPLMLRMPGTMLMPAMQMSDGLLRSARARMEGPVNNAGEALGRLRDASEGITRAMAPLQDAKNRAAAAPQPGQMGQPGQFGQPILPPGAMPVGQMPGQPRMGAQGMLQPGMGQPAMAQPGMGQPGMPPGMGRPGMGGAPGGNPAMAMPPGSAGQMPRQGPGGMGAPAMGGAPGFGGPRPMPPAGTPPPAGQPPTGAPPAGPVPAGAKPF
ncbi:MAG: hypothetical protein EXR77_17275 [Myxococcales bacterium]|nr:hypothetical protein [Myxococcales bacterium]